MYNNQAVKGGYHIRPVLFCGDISQKQEETLLSLGYDPVRLPPFSLFYRRVATHPDMLLFPLENGIVMHQAYYEEHQSFFESLPFSFLLSDEAIGQDYPNDVLFNALPVGSTLYGGKTVSKQILSAFSRYVKVKQGYTRCSSCRVGNGIITQDKTIFNALKQDGIEALLISSGHIILKGYDTGFIGGASVTLSDTVTAFFGRIEDHPDYKRMSDFARHQNARLLSLSNEPLTDCGGGFLCTPSLPEIHVKVE
ncbi:MAG: hypothetical protein IJD35_02850 [Clostridia bacterium]|nr:hypothetical protein [Clostridia bacterium]